jgi:hypothetical protein
MEIVRLVEEPGRNTIDVSQYTTYLEGVRARMPIGALAYAEAPWHYDFRDERALHDAAFLGLTQAGWSLPEDPQPGAQGTLEVRLFGSRRNGILRFDYQSATRLQWAVKRAEQPDYGDALVDEVRLSEHGVVVHEIAFEHATLVIECVDLTATWEPL